MLRKQHCPICGNGSTLIETVPTINPAAREMVQLRECDSCGHWWNSPMPTQEDLVVMYAEASPFVVSAGAKESYRGKSGLNGLQRYALRLASRAPPSTYLEIGTGGGQLLNRFRNLGFRCHGVDPGQWVEDDAISSDIDQVPSDMKFHVFVLADVLEHLADPLDMMTRLCTMADVEAKVIASFPCKDSRPARTRKGKWPMVRPYGHLHYFSRKSADMMFSAAGWKVDEMQLVRSIPLREMLLRLNIRGLAYEFLKGGRDQLYLKAVAKQGDVEEDHMSVSFLSETCPNSTISK